MSTLSIKRRLLSQCFEIVEQRIATCREAMRLAQEAANEETKSSAGDKYETGRAMMQLEIEKNLTQLNEALKQKAALERIVVDARSSAVRPGSVVTTSQGIFFIAISVGPVELEGRTYLVVSDSSPIGSRLLGLKADDPVNFAGKHYVVHSID